MIKHPTQVQTTQQKLGTNSVNRDTTHAIIDFLSYIAAQLDVHGHELSQQVIMHRDLPLNLGGPEDKTTMLVKILLNLQSPCISHDQSVAETHP